MLEYIGSTWPDHWQHTPDEKHMLESIKQQIERYFPEGRNLLINTTWFGPQFNNGLWEQYLSKVNRKTSYARLFYVAAADPLMISKQQIEEMVQALGVKEVYGLGNVEGPGYFSFTCMVIPKYFASYTIDELLMKSPKHLYINYNRKPRTHRVDLVNKILDEKLDSYGVITMGKDLDGIFCQSDRPAPFLTLGETPDDYAKEGHWDMGDAHGIPHNIHSLGNMDIWRNHFLNIVSEAEFNPWDHLVVSEKTWKPIIGLRPFILNGQTKTYKYLRDNGFYTFNDYFPVELENIPEHQVHDSIIQVIKYLTTLTAQQLTAMYNDMLPKLMHNKKQFYKFSEHQYFLVDHLFE